MRVLLYDELPSDYADVVCAPRAWCCDCRRKTLFTHDMDGIPICRECSEEREKVCNED